MNVIGLGEVLWRISPPEHLMFSQTTQLQSQFGGAELNVLGGLASLGYKTEFITVLPDNSVGQACQKFIQKHGIGCQYLLHQEGRLGLYFYERGFGVRRSHITYDRSGSAFSQSNFEQYDWETIFKEVDWFHVSGITAALSPTCYDLTLKAMKTAKNLGIGISFDLNYREQLWSSFEEARQGLTPLVELADICIGLEPISLLDQSGHDVKDKLGLTRPYEDLKLVEEIASQLTERYHLKALAFTQRELVNNSYRLKGFLYQNGQLLQTPLEETVAIDRIGTGDAFTTGIIFGHLDGRKEQYLLDTAMACFLYKHSVEGDINLLGRQELEGLLSHPQQEIIR